MAFTAPKPTLITLPPRALSEPAGDIDRMHTVLTQSTPGANVTCPPPAAITRIVIKHMPDLAIPDHVPAHLVRHYDWADMQGESDPYLHFARLHDGPDIFYTPLHGGHWVFSRYEDLDYVYRNPELFSSRHATVPVNPFIIPLQEYDGSIHKDFRNALAPFFTPKSIGNLEQMARHLTTELIDSFIGAGECDFVVEFAQKMPIIILVRLLGIPQADVPTLMPLSEDIVRSVDERSQAEAFYKLVAYIRDNILPARKAQPGTDVFSSIMQARVDGGRPMTDDEIVGLGSLLIAAGLDTVASMLGFIVRFLAESPTHRRQLIETPALINEALEEMLRRFSLSNMARVATTDVTYKDILFKAGDIIFVSNTAASIDPRHYPDPLAVDFKRADKKSMIFGRGPHQCIGAFLARTELRVFLQEWLRRIPDFSIKPNARVVAVAGKANAMRSLPITWPTTACVQTLKRAVGDQ